eukprot:TRINITY_DN20098_c0_g1_i1.p1 TRINITY_DN20098_c0_g1~~TRINITY_DN20098_c0_g1_i1.p1  ORF type:complete len:429 (+),score=118.58 TRINITY_DN20098_c0_g1_i1:54-1289(+)
MAGGAMGPSAPVYRLDMYLLENALSYLPRQDLQACMHVGRCFSLAAQSRRAWQYAIDDLVHLHQRPAGWHDYLTIARELCRLRRRPQKDSLISAALSATTTDHESQSVHETVTAKLTSFWSSTGNEDRHSSDTVTYLLAGHMSLVHSVTMTFYQADYQGNCPTYYSRKLRISVGHPRSSEVLSQLGIGAAKAGAGSGRVGNEDDVLRMSDDACWVYDSEEFEVRQTTESQTFTLSNLVPGSLLKVELIGKVATQSYDDLYYVCLQSLKVSGYILGDPSVSESLLSLLAASARTVPGYPEYLQMLQKAWKWRGTEMQVDCATTQGAQDYLICNPNLSYEGRGVDSKLDLLNRRLNLLTDKMVRKYGGTFTFNPSSGITMDEYKWDMANLCECYHEVERAQHLEAAHEMSVDG